VTLIHPTYRPRHNRQDGTYASSFSFEWDGSGRRKWTTRLHPGMHNFDPEKCLQRQRTVGLSTPMESRNLCYMDRTVPERSRWRCHSQVVWDRRERLFWGVEGDGHADNQSTWKLTEPSAGQRTQDQTHLLQGQGLQEAHPAQSHTIQGWQGTANALRTSIIHLTRSRHPCSRKESVDMIANKPVTVVRQNPCSIRRPRQRKRSC
jgi:hypothetical protein